MEMAEKLNSYIRLTRKRETKGIALNKYLVWFISFGVISFGFLSNFVIVGLIAAAGIFLGFCALNWVLVTNRNRIQFGSKFVYIPLLIIGLSMIISNVQSGSLNVVLTSLLVVYYFELYLAVGLLGKQILKMFFVAVIIEAISVVIIALGFGVRNGGIALYWDYNIATGILVFGSIIAISNRQWILVTIAAIGLFFTGAGECLVAGAVLFLTIFIRKDFGWKLIVPVSLILIIALLGIYPFEYTKMLYASQIDKFSVLVLHRHSVLAAQYSVGDPNNFTLPGDYMTDGRIGLIVNSIHHFSILGNGFRIAPNLSIDHQIHNVPLIIAQQVGPVAAAAWLFVSIYSFIKSHRKYAFIALFALCLFDFFVWDKIGAWWWILIGLATFVPLKSDLIFREEKQDAKI